MEERLIPIDIKDVKLLEWLVNRSLVNRLWNEECGELRKLIAEVESEECPVEECKELLTNYYNTVEALALLDASPFGSKNMIGQYTHQFTTKIARIVKLYERDNVYLADSAKQIIQNVKYNVPVLKKQIARCQQVKSDSVKKQTECSSNIAKYQAKFRERCAEIGIKGDHVRSELVNLLEDLPLMLSELATTLTPLAKGLEYYRKFAQFLINDSELSVCPLLHYLVEHGNVTVYQWENGVPPASNRDKSDSESSVEIITPLRCKEDSDGVVHIENEVLDNRDNIHAIDTVSDNVNAKVENSQSGSPDVAVIDFDVGDGIDFGDGGIDFGDAGGIDFGDEGGIDFGDDGGIDFGDDEGVTIELVQTGEETQHELILDSTVTRNKVIDELFELSAFLESRRDELIKHSDSILSEIPDCPPLIQTTQVETIESMLALVSDPLTALTSDKMRHLLLLKNSARYVDRLADSMHVQLKLCDKMESTIEAMKDRVQESESSYDELLPKQTQAIAATKLLKKKVEDELSKRYKGRPVKIVGDINML